MLLLKLFFIEPKDLVKCQKDNPQIIKLIGFLLRIFKESGITEQEIVDMFNRELDE